MEPLNGNSNSKRRSQSFVIKDFPEGIQDPAQLVEILQARRKPVPLPSERRTVTPSSSGNSKAVKGKRCKGNNDKKKYTA